MKISTKGRYALRMMIDLATQNKSGWVSLKEISERQDISIKYLEQIVSSLTRSRLLLSSRGPQGGYMLARAPEEYTVGEILRVIEGSLAPVACLENEKNLCARSEYCSTLKFWEGLYEVINNYVDSATLAELAKPRRGGTGGNTT